VHNCSLRGRAPAAYWPHRRAVRPPKVVAPLFSFEQQTDVGSTYAGQELIRADLRVGADERGEPIMSGAWTTATTTEPTRATLTAGSSDFADGIVRRRG
jgi:hypothetical protein